MAFYSIDTLDLPPPHESWLLHERHPQPDGPLRARPAYRDFLCRKCNRIDELKALTAGISEAFRPPPLALDAFRTHDHFLIVTHRVYDALLRVPSLDVHAFTVPSSAQHLVLFPKRQFHPPPDARLYTPLEPAEPGEAFQVRGRGCPKCGRVRQMTFRPHCFHIPADAVLAGAMVEIGCPGVSVSWIGSQQVVDVITRPEFTGWSVQPAG